MLRGTKKKTAKRRRNPDISIREIEDFINEQMDKNPNYHPPAAACKAIKHFKLDIGNSDLEDNWVTDLAWQIGDKRIYDKGKSRARKAKKGSVHGFLGIGNSLFKK